MLVTQVSVADILGQADRLRLRLAAGPSTGAEVLRVEIAPIDSLEAPAGSLVIATTRDGQAPSPYQVDVAVRHAITRRFSALLFVGEFAVAKTSRALAERGAMPLLMSASGSASELAVVIDRIVRGGAVEALSRAEYAIARVGEVAARQSSRPRQEILAAATNALGVEVTLADDPAVTWIEPDAVCVGEVPIGRLSAASSDAAVTLSLPVIASILSRALQRELQDRFAPTQSRADLIVELIFAESSRVDGFAAEAARLGMPLQLSHVVGWLRPTHRLDPSKRPPRTVQPAVELFALQLIEPRAELWHVAMIHDDVILVSTEEVGAGDHQRRLRDVAEIVMAHAAATAGEDWVYTLGLGTPQVGASGLRQSAAEARIATEAAVAAGRAGSVEVTDVTGLRRVLLDFYASPLSRRLLDDILAPLDALGAERSDIAVRTLLAYLANRNSLARAAEQLNLHPNAVNYRVRRAEQALQLKLDDPDHRFAVELACRVRLLSSIRR